ncbi:ATPase [Brevibacillus reuszeri]|uniref:ATPase n=1 Tax=Brevibacillus reuszeri TaxID=54915 RepID=A0A0K9YQ61_9BACL|nr:MoxR family ATPase [Brevibacillus reuszeri]KNB70843.1 ATPase [Brevibacillus reuszeri]MED1857233.1 MoxR family ATPase [Brevibacillus reuszeri]GED66939.1 ATPase [Brevibacillus reuszeri]
MTREEKQRITSSGIEAAFAQNGYVADRASATALQLMISLKKPLLVEGPAGVGKTEIAKVLAKVLQTRLIRLQCYEGLDVHSALYEWNYRKQLLHLKLSENDGRSLREKEADLYDQSFLLRRPLLEALLDPVSSPVLLIDEIDRADEAFEAYLLETLAEFQVTIPELGTVAAQHRPYIILTSNRTRELSDALRRRCLYQWISYPDLDKELQILHAKIPGMNTELAEQISRVMEQIRRMPLVKTPGMAETLDWALALVTLHQGILDRETMQETLGCVLKDKDDWELVIQRMNHGALLKDQSFTGDGQ